MLTGLYSHLRQAVACLSSPTCKVPSGSCGTPFEATHQTNMDVVSSLLNKFPDVVNAGKALPVPVHDVEHHIKTTGPPIVSRFWRLEHDKLEAARQEFETKEQEGIICRSTSP